MVHTIGVGLHTAHGERSMLTLDKKLQAKYDALVSRAVAKLIVHFYHHRLTSQEEKNACSSHAEFFDVPCECSGNLTAVGGVALICSEPALAHSKFTSFRVVTDVRCENDYKVMTVGSECLVAAHGNCGPHFAMLKRVPASSYKKATYFFQHLFQHGLPSEMFCNDHSGVSLALI